VLTLLAASAVAAASDGGIEARRAARTLSQVKLLYFHASWCQSCKKFEAGRVLERLDPGLRVEPVDVDVSEALLTRYGVTQTSTLVLVDADGFPLGKPTIELDDADATLARLEKLVRKMTGPR
jgi:thiol-disulfide isomerase/thioredoxin